MSGTVKSDIDKVMYVNLLKQLFEVWVNPEIEKRKEAGIFSNGTNVRRVQVLFSVEGKPIVRINEEVKVIGKVKINRPVKKGEAIYEKDIEEIPELYLEKHERDFGHITAIQFRGSWLLTFSFIYDVSKSKKLFEIGCEFLEAAKKSYDNGNLRPVVENLSVAAENLAKARIYFHPDEEIRKSKKHGTTWAKVNTYSRSQVFSEDQKVAFNRLMQTRDQARYDMDFKPLKSELKKQISAIELLKKEVNLILVRHL